MTEILALCCIGVHILYVKYLSNGQSRQVNLTQLSFPPLSVIICARNEEIHLERLINGLKTQNYPGEHEFIIINDRSSDKTAEMIKTACASDNRFKYLEIKEIPPGTAPKKNAVTVGISAASYPNLLFTDADCVPVSGKWLLRMSDGFLTGAELIIGVGAYEKKTGFLNGWIQYETLTTSFLYRQFAKRGVPYMAVGRNMGYTRSLFEKCNGFTRHHDVLSGDDDLFVQDAAPVLEPDHIAVIEHPESLTVSTAPFTFKDYLRQKRRHLSAGKKYDFSTLIRLTVFHLTHAGMYFFTLLSIATRDNSLYSASIGFILLIGLFLKYQILHRHSIGPYLKMPNFIKFLVYDFTAILYFLWSVSGSLTRKVEWKST